MELRDQFHPSLPLTHSGAWPSPHLTLSISFLFVQRRCVAPNASMWTSHLRATHAWGLVSTQRPIPIPDRSKYLGPKPGIYTVNWLLNGLRPGDRTQSLGKRPSQLPDQQPHLPDSLEWVLGNLSHFLSKPTGPGPS